MNLVFKILRKVHIVLRVILRNYFPILSIKNVKIFIDSGNHSRLEAQALCHGFYEEEESLLILNELRRDDVYLEIGGGIGFNGILASRITKFVTVVEANPKQVLKIQRNALLNNAHFNLFCGFLGENFYGVPFFSSKEFWSSNNKIETDDVVFVGGLSVDIVQNLAPTFLVIDIEGGELELIPKLFDSLLKIPRVLILELHPEVLTELEISFLTDYLGRFFNKSSRQGDSNVFLFSAN